MMAASRSQGCDVRVAVLSQRVASPLYRVPCFMQGIQRLVCTTLPQPLSQQEKTTANWHGHSSTQTIPLGRRRRPAVGC